MFNIDNSNKIMLTRGDSAKVSLFLNQGSNLCPIQYRVQEGDIIYLAIMEANQYFENATVKQVYTAEDINDEGNLVIKFNPNDTTCLIPGKYFYQIKARLLNKDGEYEVNTVIDRTEFIILE